VRTTVEPIVQMRSGLRDRIRTRDAEGVESFRPCLRGERGLQGLQI
jgi:hypothetical protein